MSNNYVDMTALTQVIGCVFNDPGLLDIEDKYYITDDDFPNEFHKIVFGAMYNLHEAKSNVTIDAIIDYLAVRPKFDAVFKVNKGVEYLAQASRLATKDTFNYYYNRMKKMTLLRAYNSYGVDVSELYDPDNVIDLDKKQKQEEWLDTSSVADIVKLIDERIDEIKSKYVNDDGYEGYQAADGILDLIDDLKQHPEIGAPLYGRLINTVTRGARLRKFYLRSAATGVGKSRALLADACNFACDEIYSEEFGMWIKNGVSLPTLFIATEQDLGEVQTMALAFLSAVNEDHILTGRYDEGEEDRVRYAAGVLSRAKLWIEEVPDFSIQDIENKMKKYIREHQVAYLVFDYVHTSMKILEEITRRSGGIKLREDNVLFMLSTKLKDLCNIYGVFILTATQLNSSWVDAEEPDQNLLRGSKSIADVAQSGLSTRRFLKKFRELQDRELLEYPKAN